MGFSNYLSNSALNHAFKNTAMIQPANLYISLHTGDPSLDGTNNEVSGFAYSRVNHNSWTIATGRFIHNDGVVDFPYANGGSWGTVTHFGVWDAITGGNYFCGGALTVSKAVGDGDTIQIADSALTITILP